ncbi:LysR family transcriptional regulator [Amycolatopsis solani]|uniref:LysR family transcriptional regulator n=1 Tax=Amycolatopsis solani TaxID=3028615 RepID=UPI0025B175C4|nr:LysR family transcriptional regulator [Amycolatopsis sp. MEP2-6]
MELRQLAVVVAVAEEGGFTAAAQRLRTVQSTVSTVVRALERDLGTPLFHRTTHRVALTPAGEAFVPAARAALEAAERARAAVSPVGGCVRVGLCPGLLADSHRLLAKLRHGHPGLAVELRRVRTGEVGCAVAESTVDVVVTALPGGLTTAHASDPAPAADRAATAEPNTARAGDPAHVGPAATPASGPTPATGGTAVAPAAGPRASDGRIFGDGLVTTPLPAEELVLATAPGGSRSAPASLSGLALVDFPPGWAIRDAVDRAFPSRRVTLEVDDLAAAAEIVRAGLAACVLPASAAARFPELTVRRFDRPPPWQLAAVHRSPVDAAVEAVLGQLG